MHLEKRKIQINNNYEKIEQPNIVTDSTTIRNVLIKIKALED